MALHSAGIASYYGTMFNFTVNLLMSRGRPVSFPIDLMGDNTRVMMPNYGSVMPNHINIPEYNQASRSLAMHIGLECLGRIPVTHDWSSSAGMLMFANDHGINLGSNPLANISYQLSFEIVLLLAIPIPANFRPNEQFTLVPTILGCDMFQSPDIELNIGDQGTFDVSAFTGYTDTDPQLNQYMHNVDQMDSMLIPDLMDYYEGLSANDYQFQCLVKPSRAQ